MQALETELRRSTVLAWIPPVVLAAGSARERSPRVSRYPVSLQGPGRGTICARPDAAGRDETRLHATTRSAVSKKRLGGEFDLSGRNHPVITLPSEHKPNAAHVAGKLGIGCEAVLDRGDARDWTQRREQRDRRRDARAVRHRGLQSKLTISTQFEPLPVGYL